MERMQAEAEALKAEGIVGVHVDETNHTWGPSVLEFSAVGTAVVAIRADHQIPRPEPRPHGERLMAATPRDRHARRASRSSPGGGIPLRASERLAEEAGPHSKLFTSDLSVNEFLLARDAGCEPIAQVMGSSIFHIGQIPDYKGATAELTVISDGHRDARAPRALAPLPGGAGSSAPTPSSARIRERMITMGPRGKGGDDGGEVIEFTVVGTAVRAPFLVHPPGQPVVTDLSGPGPLGARAGRLGAVRLPLRVLPVPRVARHRGAAAASARSTTRARGRRDGARDRRRTRMLEQATRRRRRVRRRQRRDDRGERGPLRLRQVHARRPRRRRELVRHRHPPHRRDASASRTTCRRSCSR